MVFPLIHAALLLSGLQSSDEAEQKAVQQTDTRKLIAVAPLATGTLRKEEADLITETFSTAIQKRQVARVMERSQVEKILKEQGFNESGACDNSECAIQIGKLLGLDQLVVGSVGRLGDAYVLNARLVDVGTGEVLGSTSQTISGKIELVVTNLVPNASADLFNQGSAKRTENRVAKPPISIPAPISNENRRLECIAEIFGAINPGWGSGEEGHYGAALGASYRLTNHIEAKGAVGLTRINISEFTSSPYQLFLSPELGLGYRAIWNMAFNLNLGIAIPLMESEKFLNPTSFFYVRPQLDWEFIDRTSLGAFVQLGLTDLDYGREWVYGRSSRNLSTVGLALQRRFDLPDL